MTNISLSEYIRKRRISLAAVDLQTGEDKIIDIALKYGYESPTAFNRAFQAVHGIAPSLVRKKNVQIKSFPALKF
ncbi:helix-turn-helix transcriptional regulator, partial [Blautia faecis]